ncbi:MAG: TetR/AcrR family transcriptional regulator [Phocaeicola sp.]
MNSKGKELILEKCFELLIVKGFDAVSITDIQRETTMSRGLIYHYYSNKEELFMEVIDRYLLNLFRFNMEQIKTYTITEMIAHIEKMYREICNKKIPSGNQSVTIMNYDFLFYQAALRNEEFKKKHKKVRDDELVAWQIVVENSMHQGELKAGLEIEKLAKTFIYLTDGAWFNIGYRTKQSDAAAEITQMLTHYYDLIKRD